MKSESHVNIAGDADLDCEAELRERFNALVECGLKSGRTEVEVANALLSLAQSYALDLNDDALIEAPVSNRLQ